jgi:hypothetical protein
MTQRLTHSWKVSENNSAGSDGTLSVRWTCASCGLVKGWSVDGRVVYSNGATYAGLCTGKQQAALEAAP